jgi:hypothetical protein
MYQEEICGRKRIEYTEIFNPVMCYNADGTLNQLGQIMEYVEMQMTIDEHEELVHLQ